METNQRASGAESTALPPGTVHELRTPLNQIIGYSEMLMEQAQEAGHDGYVPDLQRVRDAGHQLLALIAELSRSVRVPGIALPAPVARERRAPRREREAALAALPDQTRGVSPESLRGAVLVVDDIEANRDVLSRRLEKQGYDVATAESGRQALDMMRAEEFELVLLDVMMPELDGYEVLRRLKADPGLKHIPVIMISALTEMDGVARCIEMGAEDYLPKPFDPILLKARIGASLEKKRARDREVYLFNQLQRNFDRLQALEKLRDDLTNMIVHDLRTPLNAVINGMQTLEMLGELNESQRRMMQIAVGGGETLLGMINDLLDVEKLESGAMQLDMVLLSPSDLVASAVNQVASLAEGGGLSLRQEIADDLPIARGDEGKLRRALVNLLGNAIKFTPTGGTVTIAAQYRADDRMLVFAVTDTGEGIPPEAFERIFEKFGQVESRQGGRTMSTGLGLAFCRLAVEAHGGQIEVASTLGVGSTFRFTLPLPPADG